MVETVFFLGAGYTTDDFMFDLAFDFVCDFVSAVFWSPGCVTYDIFDLPMLLIVKSYPP